MHSCFTKPEIKKYDLDGLTPDQQVQRINELIGASENNKRKAKLQGIKLYSAIDKIKAHPKGAVAGLKALLVTDRSELSATSGVEAQMMSVGANFRSKLYASMERLMPTKFGLDTKKADQLTMLKALRGEDVTDPSFKNFSSSFADIAEQLRLRFNRAGGNISKLKNWNYPMSHDEFLVGKSTFNEWLTKITPLLDLEEMGYTKDSIAFDAKGVYDSIISGGMKDKEMKVSSAIQMANRHNQQRFFVFKDAESQYKYMQEFSDSSVYNGMMDYVTVMSNEIALMERFGPSPNTSMKNLFDTVQAETGKRESTNSIEKIWNNLSGKTNPWNRKWADRMQSVRNVEVGLKLTGAVISAMPDMMFNSMTANYNGLPAMAVMKRFISNLSPNKKADRELAASLHQPLLFMLDEANSAMRFADVGGHRGSAKFATFTMRASGLNAWTVAGKMAFHAEFMHQLGKGDYPDNMLRSFRRYGITPKDQEVIKNAEHLIRDGVRYLDPAKLPTKLAEKIVSMIVSETKYAVPEGDALVRAVLNQGTQRGTLGGEALRGAAMFKTFPVTIVANHWARALKGFEGNKANRVGYASAMLIGTWALGMTAYQLKEIAKGREVAPWDSKELWKQGALVGGSFSLLGDIMNKDSRSFGNSSADFIAGPIGSDVQKIVWQGILGSMDDARETDASLSDMAKKGVAGMANYVPGQFPYSKMIMNRMFLDSMRKLGDPDYDFKKQMREQEHENLMNERWFK